MRSILARFRRPYIAGLPEQLMLMNSTGDGSTLTLDFTTGVLDPRLTFTRSTTGTYINSSGYVTSAAINAPRFDHDPTTLAPRGLLIEGAATNVCEQGQYCWGAGTINSWGRSANIHINAVNGTSGANAVPRIDGPDGGSLTGTSIFKDSGSTFVRLNQNVAVVQNTTYTFSAYVRAPSGGNPYIRVAAFNGGTWLNTTGGCTLSSVTITNTVGAGSVFNGVPSGSWVRVWVTFTTQAAQTTATIAFYPDADTSNAATMYCWGAQVETGSGPSSVIPTGASTGSRVQDLVAITSTNFSSWWTSNNPASFLVDISSTNRPLANHIFRIADSSGSAYGYQSYFNSTTMPMQVRAAMSSTASSDIAIGSNLAANTRTKIGFTVETASLKRFRDGSLAHTLATPTLPPNTLTQMYIGGTSSFGNASADFHIKQFKYWPVTLSDAAMQGFTT